MSSDTHPTDSMIALDVHRIERIMASFDRAFHEVVSGFPECCCTWAAATICEALRGAFYYDRARWTFRVVHGEFDRHGHYWVAGSRGYIFDPTVGQFVRGPAWRVVAPDDQLQERYVLSPVIRIATAEQTPAGFISTN